VKIQSLTQSRFKSRRQEVPSVLRLALIALCAALSLPFLSEAAIAHAVVEGDKGYIQEITGIKIMPFV